MKQIDVSKKIVDGKTCSRCKEHKKISQFTIRSTSKDGHISRCKDCHKIYNQKYYKNNKQKCLDNSIEYRKKNPHCRRDAHRKVKQQILDAYGRTCTCCGEHRFELLTLEHTRNDGKAERKKHGDGHRYYQYLKKNGFPKDKGLTILCYNCNTSKGRYGYCPHERENQDTEELVKKVTKILDDIKIDFIENPYTIGTFDPNLDYDEKYWKFAAERGWLNTGGVYG